jgi:hypothetical protein
MKMPLVWGDLGKLLLAAFLGGLIGLEREAKHRPAGLRTNLFICVGAAIFTLLSDQLAGQHAWDHTRIAHRLFRVLDSSGRVQSSMLAMTWLPASHRRQLCL